MERKHGTWRGVAIWAVVVLTALVALPWAVDDRLPERLATHWSAGSGGRPDDSMPLWAAAVFPGSIWVALVLLIVVLLRRADGTAPGRAMRNRAVAGLLSGGVFLAGAQASVVLANLDHADWRQADPVSVWAVLTSGVAATVAGLAGWAVTRRVGRGAVGGRRGGGLGRRLRPARPARATPARSGRRIGAYRSPHSGSGGGLRIPAERQGDDGDAAQR